MNFTDYLFESLDSIFKISKREKENNVDFYCVEMSKLYRIFIEEIIDNGTHPYIGFERFANGDWHVKGVTKDLTAKEVLGLFGTIKKIISSRMFNSLYIRTDEKEKIQLYHNMMRKLNDHLDFGIVSRNDNGVLLYNGNHRPKIESKIKYKK